MDNPALAAEVDDRGAQATPMDARQFVQHYEEWRQPIYRYLRSRSAPNEDAADLTATTFERACEPPQGARRATPGRQ